MSVVHEQIVRPPDGGVVSLATEADAGAIVFVRRVVLRHTDRLPHELLLAPHRAAGTEHVNDAASQSHVEAAVQDGIKHAIKQRHRLGEHVHRPGDDVAVLAPDVDQVHDEVRRPAHDETADDRQGHLDRSHFGSRDGLGVALGLAQGHAAVSVRDVLALAPDDPHDVDVAIGDDGAGDDEDVGG